MPATEVRELRRAVEQLSEDLHALRAQHLSLRGRVYALWGKEKQTEESAGTAGNKAAGTRSAESPPAKLNRDELRRLAGLKPGKPYQHPESSTNSEE